METPKIATGGGPAPVTTSVATSTTTTSAKGFVAPKVPVSYFDEMVTKYQEQAEYHHIYQQMQIDKEAELNEQRRIWSEERTAAYIAETEKKKQAEEELQRTIINTSVGAAQTISNALFTIGRNRTNNEKKQQIARIKNSNKSEQEKQKAIEALEKEAFEKNKKRSIFQAIINGALGVTKTIANLGFPAATPALVLQGIATAASIATIASQKFAKGGIVQKEPGKGFTGDQHLIRANPGEMVLTKEQQRNIGANVSVGDTNIIIQGNVTEETLDQIDQTLEDRNESLRQQLLELSESGRITGVAF
jgi:hypothetical protein